MEKIFGRHFIVDFSDCDESLLERLQPVREILLGAARDCGATIVDDRFHQYEPVGVSGVVLIAESHLSIHTWPEHRYASLDIFTCGESMDPEVAIEIMARDFKSEGVAVTELERSRNSRTVCPTPR